MKIEIMEMQERKAKLLLTETNPTLANALRRVMIADVPKLAIENVEFHLGTIGDESGTKEFKSATPLFDEMIAHRLGLVPIPTDLDVFNLREQCEACGGEGCPSCTVIYSLNKRGPCTVYSGDLHPVGEVELRVVDDLIPLVKLADDQAILIYAIAELGTAQRHAKWQATSGVGYKYYPNIMIDQDLCDKCDDCIEICPMNILERKKNELIVTDVEACKLCKSCTEVCKKDAIKIEALENKLILRYETDGSLTSEAVLKKSLEILQEKFGGFVEMVQGIE